MNEPVRITFYHAAAGYYRYRAEQPAFGGLADTLQQLQEWGDGTRLSLTKILDPSDDADELPVYLLGVQRIGDDWLLGCWNEVPSVDNTVASIAMNSVVGQAPQIHQNDMAPDTIPGYATYFWVVPQSNVVASIRFSGVSAGREAMQTYVRNFLSFESRYVKYREENGETVIVGHGPVDTDFPTGARPRFKLSTYKKRGKRAYLLENHERIRKVIRKGQVTLENVIERNMFQNFVRFVRGDGDQPNVLAGTRSARIELEYTPSFPELNAMIEADDEAQDGSRWDDLGFELQGEPGNIIWINKSRASESYEFNVERELGVVTMSSVAASIAMHRQEILEILNDA